MRCPACGKQLPEDLYFCAYCGAVVQSRPAPFPRVSLNGRALGLALGGTAAALPVSLGFWLLAGQLALLSGEQRIELGALVAVLAGLSVAGLQGQIGWPTAAQRWSPRDLGVVYGLGGGLTVTIGGLIVGAVVLPVAWGLTVPTLPEFLAGTTTGLVAIVFALPPAVLIGYVAGYGLGQLAGPGSTFVATWGAALAWWLAGSTAGGVAGGFVAARTNLALSTGVWLGAILQGGVQVVMLPLAIYLVHWYLVLTA